jgi:hypothetical protein
MSNIDVLEELLGRIRSIERRQSEKPNRNQKEAARYLGMSVSKLQQLHKEGAGPRRSTIGRTHYYKEEDLEAFLAKHEDC